MKTLSGSSLLLTMGLAAAALIACSSEEEAPTKSGSSSGGGSSSSIAEAKAFFVGSVYPNLQKNCANGCHDKGQRGAPIYLSDSGEGSYNAIEGISGYIAAPTSSPLRQKGLHSGPGFTDAQGELVDKWLKMEVNARKLSGDTGKPANLREGFKKFGECMSYKRWMELKLNEVATVATLGNTGPCFSCHVVGQSSLWLSENSAETFAKFTQYPYIQKLVVGRVSSSGSFDGLEGSRRLMDKGTEAQQPQSNSHPRYTLSTEQTNNLTLYVNETLTNMSSGNCVGDQPDGGADGGKK